MLLHISCPNNCIKTIVFIYSILIIDLLLIILLIPNLRNLLSLYNKS